MKKISLIYVVFIEIKGRTLIYRALCMEPWFDIFFVYSNYGGIIILAKDLIKMKMYLHEHILWKIKSNML